VTTPPDRRTVLALGASGTAFVLTGCSVYGGSNAAPAPAEAPSKEAPTTGADDAASDDAPSTAPAEPATPALARTADIPVGGGKIFKGEGVVVTQPAAGTFAAFSTTCPHQGCAVNEIKGGTINCPCHGSKFKVADGSVDAGPATSGLPKKKLVVDGDSLRLA
jgi:Rieske Fe-S protein